MIIKGVWASIFVSWVVACKLLKPHDTLEDIISGVFFITTSFPILSFVGYQIFS